MKWKCSRFVSRRPRRKRRPTRCNKATPSSPSPLRENDGYEFSGNALATPEVGYSCFFAVQSDCESWLNGNEGPLLCHLSPFAGSKPACCVASPFFFSVSSALSLLSLEINPSCPIRSQPLLAKPRRHPSLHHHQFRPLRRPRPMKHRRPTGSSTSANRFSINTPRLK